MILPRTIEYLTSPDSMGLFWPGVVTAVALAALCSVLSVLVVLKRLAFVGQGVSHAAFGGVGVAAIAGFAGAVTGAGSALSPEVATLVQFGVVLAFCVGAAMLMGALTRRGKTEADSAIGIVLVASMAAGAVLIELAESGVGWESFLFGSIFSVAWVDAALAWGAAVAVLMTLWMLRRPMLFWAFDEPASAAWGVRGRWLHFVLLGLLALATVTAMKLAGVVLATALLVLPGATALRLSRRWNTVVLLSLVVAQVGMLGGLVLAFETDWPPGPAIVLTLTAMFAAAWVAEQARGRKR